MAQRRHRAGHDHVHTAQGVYDAGKALVVNPDPMVYGNAKIDAQGFRQQRPLRKRNHEATFHPRQQFGARQTVQTQIGLEADLQVDPREALRGGRLPQ